MENGNYQNPNGYNYNYYQNLYNMFGTHNPIIDQKASDIRKLSMFTGGACLIYVIVQYIFVLILASTGMITPYTNDVIVQNALNIFCSIIALLLPFLFVYHQSTDENKKRIMKFDRPKDAILAVLAVFAGLAVCLVSNVVGNFILGIFSVFGIEFTSGMEDVPVAKDFAGYIITILCYAVVPALIEEFAFRGVVLQPLRKYGDKFAIIVSSLIFSLMHGNMVQIPTAFISGLALGYFCIKTESLWTSVMIHFVNNFISSIMSIYFGQNPDASDMPAMIILFGIGAIGAAAIVFFFTMNKKQKLAQGDTLLSPKLKRSIYICTPTVVLTIIHSMYNTFNLQKINQGLGMLLMIALLIAITVIICNRINLIKNERQISIGSKYKLSKIFIVAAAILGTLMIVGSTFADKVGTIQ